MAEHRMRRRETPIWLLFAAVGVATAVLIVALWWLVAGAMDAAPVVPGG